MDENSRILEGSSYILNPIANVNGYLTSADEIYDLEQGQSQAELNKLIKLSSGVSEIQEFYAVYEAPVYKGDGDMREDTVNVHWVQVPSPSGEEFPTMTLEKPYLWNYEKFVQTGGEIISTEPHVTGVLGRGLKTNIRYYLVNSNPNVKPESDDENWNLQSPPTTDACPYLWEKQEIFYSDNATQANPDEVVITLIGVKGEDGVDGTQVEYIFCFGNSRVQAPANPTPTGEGVDFRTDENYQQADYIPYPTIADYNPGVDGYSDYYWSDEPVGVSKENPAQWICKRELIIDETTGKRYWGAFSNPKLYSTYGEDGVSIEKIEVRYLISNVNTLTDEIENAKDGNEGDDPKQPNLWYKSSPAVNHVNKYLWKKTITSYSAAGIDNPDTELDETKIKTSYNYEVIGSMGDPGIDGDSVEWIYTRTKTNDRPELDSSVIDNTITDKNYSDYQQSDYIPYPRFEDFEKGLSEHYWSDDIQAVDDTYIYGWRSQRKKSKNSDGTQTWKNFSLPVQILYKAQDGVSPNTSFKSIIFIRSNGNPGKPSAVTENGFNTYENPVAPGWSDGIPEGTDALWSSTRIFSTDGLNPQQDSWSEPKVMTDTLDVEIIYCARENFINPNDFEKTFSKDEEVINSEWLNEANNLGWWDEPDQVEFDTQKTDVSAIWMAISRKVGGKWSKWEISKIKGERGNDGTSIKVSGHYDKLSDFQNEWQDESGKWINPETVEGYSAESCFVVEGNLWVWDGSDEWSNVGQFKGDPGKSQFLHVVYANIVETRKNEESGEEYIYIELTESDGTVPGKFITTWSDEFSATDVSLETLKTRTWTKWLGDDGYGYEYIYKLTTKNDPPQLPTQNEDKNDFVPKADVDTDPNYGWTDNPQNVSAKKPFCWQAYRVKVDGKWGNWKGHADTNEAALWSKYGKDGKGINSISYWFCIDDIEDFETFKNAETNYQSVETLPEGTTASPKTWYKNSPAVTDDFKYLWKKTITEYTEENEDGTTGLENQTVLELIGIKGAKGVDGNDIEWAFKLTKDFTQPTSLTEGDKWPTGEISTNELGEWTDDAQDVSEEWQYQWIIKRSKVNGSWTAWGNQATDEKGDIYYKSTLNNTYGNHIKDTESYYIASNSKKISSVIPEQVSILENYKKSLADLGWQNSKESGDTIVPTPVDDKLYEISIFIFTDNTFTISGPIVKAMWLGTDIQSTVFCRASSKPTTPVGGKYDTPYPDDVNLDGSRKWSDGIPERKEGESTTIWSSTAVFIPGSEGPKNGWSEPMQLTDTASLQIRYSENETKPENNPPSENNGVGNGWIKTATENAIWMATRSYSYGEWDEWQILKVKGETGKDSSHPNLFLNSGFENEEDPFKYWIVDIKEDTDLSALLVEKAGEQGVNGINGRYDLSYDITDRIIPGEIYTISFRLSFMSKNSVKIDLRELIESNEDLLNYSIENLTSTTIEGSSLALMPNDNNFINKKVFFTFRTKGELGDGERLIFKLISNNDTYGYATHTLKLEDGSVVTDYTRAQEDLKGKDGAPGKDGIDGKDGRDGVEANPNLLKNTNFDLYKTIGEVKTLRVWEVSDGTVEEESYEGFNVFVKENGGTFLQTSTPVLQPNKYYTLSLLYKTSLSEENTTALTISFRHHIPEDYIISNYTSYIYDEGETKLSFPGTNGDWQLLTLKFNFINDAPGVIPSIKLNGIYETGEIYYISKIKLEAGDQATPYIKSLADYIPAVKSTIFIRSSETPDTPNDGNYEHPIATNWSDGIPSGKLPIYSSTCTFYPEGDSTGWSEPQLMADNPDFEVMYSPLTERPNIPLGFNGNSEEWWNMEGIAGIWFNDPTEQASDPIWMATNTRVSGNSWTDKWIISKIKGENGDSPYYADLDNEMDSIGLTSTGLADNDYTDISTNVRLWCGTLPLQLKENIEEGVKLSGVPAGISCNKTYDENRHSCEIKFSVSKGTEVAERNAIKITLVSVDEITRDLTFTLNGIKAGSDGTPAKLYRIQPTVNQIIKDQNGNLFPTAISCNTILSVGGELTENPEGVTLNYYIDDNSEIAGTVVNGSLIQLGGLEITKNIKFVLIENSSNKTIDTETVVIISEGKDGEPGAAGTSPIYADLDNEMDSVALSYLGVVENDTKLTTNVSMWKGEEELTLTSLRAELTTGKTGSILFEDGDIDLETGRVTCTVYKDTELDLRNIVTIYLSAANEDRILTFTINGLKAGSKGESAKIYRLTPTSSQIIRKNDGSTEPQDLVIHASRTIGNEIISSESGSIVEGEITYSIDGKEQEMTLAPGGVIYGETLKTINRSLKLTYKVSGVLVDSETIPVVRDGIDGKGSVTVDIDSEMDSIALDVNGYAINTGDIVTHVRLWLGTEARTIKEINAGDIDGFEKVVSLDETTSTVGTVIFKPKSGEVIGPRNVSTISLIDSEGIDRAVTFTILAVRAGEDGETAKLYKIQTNYNQIKRDSNNNFLPQTIECTYITVNGNYISTDPTDEVKFRYYINGVLQETTATTLNIQSELITKSLKLELIKTDSDNNITVVDSETIPVIVDGKDGVNPIIADLDNEMDSIALTTEGYATSLEPIKTTVWITNGTTKVGLYNIVVNKVQLTDTEPKSVGFGFECQYIKNSDNTTYELRFTPKDQTTEIPAKAAFPIELYYDGGSHLAILNFTINGIRASKDGAPAVLYSLQPSTNQIVKKKNGNYFPDTINCSCYQLREGIQSNLTNGENGISLKYILNNDGNEKEYSTIIPNDEIKSIKYVLYVNGNKVDIETISVIEEGIDGKSGTSPIIADLDNEMDSIALTVDGYAISQDPIETTVWISKGDIKQRLVSLKINGCEFITEKTTTPRPYNGAAEISGFYVNLIHYSGNLYKFSLIPKLDSIIPSKTTFPIILGYLDENNSIKTHELNFTINGIRAAKDGSHATLYKLQPSTNQVVKKKDKLYYPNTLTCSCYQLSNGVQSELTNGTDGVELKYILNGGENEVNYSTITMSDDIKSVKYILYVNGNKVDIETISVVEEGIDGNDGIGINSVTTFYMVTAAYTKPGVSDTNWKQEFPDGNLLVAGSYLWVKTVTDFTDSKKADSVSISVSKIGENGTSISITGVDYAKGNNPTTYPTEEEKWGSEIPKTEEGEYLWCRTTFSDTTKTYTVSRNGSSPIYADIDNEMDSWALDKNGFIIGSSEDNALKVKVGLWQGSKPVPLTLDNVVVIEPLGKEYTINKQLVVGSSEIELTYTPAEKTDLSGKFTSNILLTKDNESRSLTFTINGIKPGADGAHARLYRLQPNANQIVVKKDGSFVPNTIKCSILVTENEQAVESTGTIINYYINDESKGSLPTSGIAITSEIRSIKFEAVVGETVMDSETIPVISDGADGKDLEIISIKYATTIEETQPNEGEFKEAVPESQPGIYIWTRTEYSNGYVDYGRAYLPDKTENPIIADLDNEMDSIALTAEGKALNTTDTIETNVWVTKGYTKLALNTLKVSGKELNSSSNSIDLGNGFKCIMQYNSLENIYKLSFSPVDTSTVISTKTSIPIELIYYADENIELKTSSLNFTINGIKAARDGQPAKLYKLIVFDKEIKVNKDGTRTPEYINYNSSVTFGENTIENPEGTKINYYIDGVFRGTVWGINAIETPSDESTTNTTTPASTTDTTTTLAPLTTTISPNGIINNKYSWDTEDITKTLKLELVVGENIVDTETIFVVSDGADGTSPIFADLDNEMDSVALTADGKIASTTTITTNVSLFRGNTELNITKLNTTVESGANYLNGSDVIVCETNSGKYTGKITVNLVSGNSLDAKNVIKITLGNESETRDLYLTINGVKAAKDGTDGKDGTSPILCKLQPSVNQIIRLKNNSGTNPSGNITCDFVSIQDGKTITNPTSYKLYYSKDGGTEEIWPTSGVLASSITKNIKFILKNGSDILDTETVPVITEAQDGKDGIDGLTAKPNLLKNTNYDLYNEDGITLKVWKDNNNNYLNSSAYIETISYNGYNSLKKAFTGTGGSTIAITDAQTVNLKSGNIYTLSCYSKYTGTKPTGTSSLDKYIYGLTFSGLAANKITTISKNNIYHTNTGSSSPGTSSEFYFGDYGQQNKWILHQVVFKPLEDISNLTIRYHCWSSTNGLTLYYTHLKLEEGNEATPYQKNQSDLIGESGKSPQNNLLFNSDFEKLDNWKSKDGDKWYTPAFGGEIIRNQVDGVSAYYASRNYGTDKDYAYHDVLVQPTEILIPSTWYTLSFYCKGNAKLYTYIYPDVCDTSVKGIVDDSPKTLASNTLVDWSFVSSNYTYHYVTFKTASNISGSKNVLFRLIDDTSISTNTIYICQPKLERSNVPTSWTVNKNDLVGPAGTMGRNMYPAGNWDSTRNYKIENNSVPFVFYNNVYYILTADSSGTGTENAPDKQSEKWGKFEYTPFQFSEFLMAKWAKFGGENGAVFFDKYLFSQYGYTKETGERAPYWDYESSMFDANNNLTDVFTPKLHLDFYNGLANLSCLCEPYVTPRESTTEPGVIRISPDSGFNIKIPCNCPNGETDPGDAQPMLHPVVVLPNLDDEGEQTTWAFDGAHVTILFEPGGQKYGRLSGPYASKIDKQNVFLLVCTDLGETSYKSISSPDPTYDQNLIFCNNKRGKYLILSPGSMVKLKVNIIENNGSRNLHWIVENSGAVKEESVNIYTTSNCVSNIGESEGRVVLDDSKDSLVRLHGADYPDYINVATSKLPTAWGIMFYSGPEGFCPKNILFSSQQENGFRSTDPKYKYHYRALDFIGKTGNYGSPLDPPDQANNFDYDPLI